MNVLTALIAGLLGGLLTRYVAPPIAFAQDQTSLVTDIRSQSFTLADSLNRTIGAFTVEPIYGPLPAKSRFGYPPLARGSRDGLKQTPPKYPTQMRMVLRGSDGQEIWSATEDLK
jgi:hypothetical protein